MYLHIVAVTIILCQTKRWFAFSKIVFCAGTKVFEDALNAVKFLGWLKNLDRRKTFWDLQKDKALLYINICINLVCISLENLGLIYGSLLVWWPWKDWLNDQTEHVILTTIKDNKLDCWKEGKNVRLNLPNPWNSWLEEKTASQTGKRHSKQAKRRYFKANFENSTKIKWLLAQYNQFQFENAV